MTVAQLTVRWGILVQADEGRAVNAAWTGELAGGLNMALYAKREAT